MAIIQRIANLFRTDRLAAELDEELAFHIAERTDDLVAEGMTERDARREARRRFGHYVVQREETKDMNIYRWLEAFLGDLRYGVRQLWLNPGFAAVAILSLALGIGANSAIFQLINALRLKTLPVESPHELAVIDRAPDFSTSGWYSARNEAFTFAQYEAMREQTEAFTDLLAFGTANFNLSQGGEARYAEGLWISPNFLEVLGVSPVVGAWLDPRQDPADCTGAGALLDYSFWQREYGGDPAAVGKDIYIDGRSFPIVGVTPASFRGVEAARRYEVALPICADALIARDGQGRIPLKWAWWLTPIGRLKPGWTVEQASAHMTAVSPGIFAATLPARYRPDGAERYLNNKLEAESAAAGLSSLREDYQDPLWLLLGIAGLVLLIACANLANLLLARASVRQREVALRQAVGASRVRLVGQLMAESFLLAGLGALLGSLMAVVLGRSLVTFLSQGGQTIDVAFAIDWRVFGFTAVLALFTCVLFGLAPALGATHQAPAGAMRGSRGSLAASDRHGLRRGLVVAQIGLSLVLLVGALLFWQSLQNLLETDTGMETDGVLVARVDADLPDIEPERRRNLYRELTARMNALPDVLNVSRVSMRPFSGSGWNEDVYAGDATEAEDDSMFSTISPDYFATLNTPLLAGREFTEHDDNSAPKVAIVNEVFVEQFLKGADPVGNTFWKTGNSDEGDTQYRIVGHVKNTRYYELREEPRPIAFLPLAQDENAPDSLSFLLRVRGPMDRVMGGVTQLLKESNPGLLVDYRVMAVEAKQSVLREELMANLSAGFGILAALLSALGLYGVMSYMVARRRNEIGVRMALGAERGDIFGLVLSEAGRLVIFGLVVGLAGSFALSRYAESLLYGLEPNDVTTLAMGCGLLALTALFAAVVPIRRATRMDPAVVLRDE